MPLPINDGMTRRRVIEAADGFHPEVAVEYRPALAEAAREHSQLTASAGAKAVTDFESRLLVKHIVSADGDPWPFGDEPKKAKEYADSIPTVLRTKLVNLVLGYLSSEATEGQRAKNLPSE